MYEGDPPIVLGVAGSRTAVANSLSPRMFEAAIDAAGLRSYYVPLAIRESAGRKALRSLARLGFGGANVTMPFKAEAAEVAHSRSELVQRTGVANTLVISASGHVHAEATDGLALASAIKERGVDLTGRSVTIMGAGGAAIEAAFACVDAGAQHIAIWNRSRQRAQDLVTLLHRHAGGVKAEALDRARVGADCAVLIGAVPAQVLEGYEPDMSPGTLVVDFAYRADGRPTPLEHLAGKRGARVVNGREMLVRQGAESFRLWFGIDAPIQVMRDSIAVN